MGYFVRVVKHIDSWPSEESPKFKVKRLKSDAISELSTVNNELSWWHTDNPQEDTLAKVTAAILSKNNDIPKIIYLVVIPEEILNKKFHIANTPDKSHALTLIDDMRKHHHDMQNINYKLLGVIAKLIANGTSKKRPEIKIIPLDRDKVIKELAKACTDRRLDINKLKNEVLKLVQKWIDSHQP